MMGIYGVEKGISEEVIGGTGACSGKSSSTTPTFQYSTIPFFVVRSDVGGKTL
jgi:hypothetical protein